MEKFFFKATKSPFYLPFVYVHTYAYAATGFSQLLKIRLLENKGYFYTFVVCEVKAKLNAAAAGSRGEKVAIVL